MQDAYAAKREQRLFITSVINTMESRKTVPSQPLQYQPRLNASRDRWKAHFKLVAFVVFVILVGLLAEYIRTELWPSWRRKIHLYTSQRACLNFTAPADQIVFETNPAKVAILANNKNYTVVNGCAYHKIPEEWATIYANTFALARFPDAPVSMIFLHERNIAGQKHLLALECFCNNQKSPLLLLGYDVLFYHPDPSAKHPYETGCWVNQLPDPNKIINTPSLDLRIYAGQPIPGDPTRFTVRYENNGETFLAKLHINDKGWLVVEERSKQ